MKKFDVEIGFGNTTALVSVLENQREVIQEMLNKLPFIDRTYLSVDKTKIGLFISNLAEQTDFDEMETRIAEIVNEG